jgi:glutamate-5-semialdehyde dehydrogenase
LIFPPGLGNDAGMNAEPDTNISLLAAAAGLARAAAAKLARSSSAERNQALTAAADALLASTPMILAANQQDLAQATGSAAFQDRLLLNATRIGAMAQGLRDIAALPDPLARVLAEWTRPNGLVISRVPQPIGVLGMIYESRPNVGADAAALAIKSGNAILLRGGSESFYSARAIHAAIAGGLLAAGLPEAAVQIAPTADRGFVAAMLAGAGLIDLIIPRGGRGLVERVQREARVPVLAHAEGLNHSYVHAQADFGMARRILANAKMRRTGVCGATETLLIDREIAPALLPLLVSDLTALGCDFRADPQARQIVPALPAASAQDFDTEWLDAILNVKIVDGLQAALAHIAAHGSQHTDAIITENAEVAEMFLKSIGSAVGLWNASTQFCDGGEFGFGGEIGIATGHVHARGPVGVEQLTTFRYIVRGTGQVRP